MLAEAEAAVPRISPEEASRWSAAPTLFLDRREPPEVAASGQVPGALAIPRGGCRVPRRSCFGDARQGVRPQQDRDRLLCVGRTFGLVGKTLKDMGYASVATSAASKGWVDAGGVEKN